MTLGYVISTNQDYERVTLPLLLTSLVNVGIEDYIVFSGRYDRYEKKNDRRYHLPYAGWENTALIATAELDVPYTHVFLLHDTCEVGPEFPHLTEQYDRNVDMTVVHNAMCSFGVYSVEFLKRQLPFLLTLRNLDKMSALTYEGYMYRFNLGTSSHFPNDAMRYEGDRDVYGTGKVRRVEYYAAVDLWKYKANYGQNMHNLTTEV